ncbi:MAG: ABC transporter permease [Candidatus Neomarinimicrobiota bacterium]|jgi:ABC-2 type transport system permease protein|nr:ABC transporter permease [Candidatus Neomarinimicrobiota bacterium]
MRGFTAALWSEYLKARRSIILWITIVIFAFISLMMGLFIYLAQHPELISNSAILNAKTSMLGQTDWPGYFILLHQMGAILGMIGFGFVFSWIFGREYSDRTLKDLLALPVSRVVIINAKLIIATIWSLILAIILLTGGIISGRLVGIDGWSAELCRQAACTFAGTILLTIFLCPPVAFFASYGRGFLVPIGYLILIMMITQFAVTAVPGIAPYFPWAIPALYSGAAGPESSQLGLVSYLILAFTGFLGIAGTIAWWRYADQK